MEEKNSEFTWAPFEYQFLLEKLIVEIADIESLFDKAMDGWDTNDADDRVMAQQNDPTKKLNSLLNKWYHHFDTNYDPPLTKIRQSWNFHAYKYENAAKNLFDYLINFSNKESSVYRPRIFEAASEEVMSWLKKNPRDIIRSHDRSFELIVGEIIKKKGWDITVTKKTRDGGYDIIGVQNDDLGFTQKMIVECKRYDLKRNVGLAIIDRLMGVKYRISADKAVCVTTSNYTKPVWKEWEYNIGRNLELVDRDELFEWLSE